MLNGWATMPLQDRRHGEDNPVALMQLCCGTTVVLLRCAGACPAPWRSALLAE